MTEADSAYQYDVFISYSHHDLTWVRDSLVKRLEAAGLRTSIDYDTFEIGSPSVENMVNAISCSRKIVLVLTPDWVQSDWTRFEGLISIGQNPLGGRLVPLFLKPTKPPAWLGHLTYHHFTEDPESEFQFKRLIARLKNQAPPPGEVPVKEIDYTPYLTSLIKCDYPDIWDAFGERFYSSWRDQYVPLYLRVDAEQTNEEVIELGLNVVRKFSPLIITGDPGAGKTTALRHLVEQFAREALDTVARTGKYSDSQIPICVNLKEYERHSSGYESILLLIQSELRSKIWQTAAIDRTSAVQAELEKQPFVLLFDGLNEVPEKLQELCAYDLRDLVKRFSKHLYVIASRKVSYQSERLRLGFPNVYAIDGLSDKGIAAYLNRYLRDAESVEDIISQLNESTRLRELAQNPLFLAIMIQVRKQHYESGEDVPLYKSQGKLIGRCARRMIEIRSTPEMANLKRSVLTALGYVMQLKGLQLEEHDVTKCLIQVLQQQHMSTLKPQRVTKDLLHDQILTRTEDGRIGFWHQAFQEYFAACQIRHEWRNPDTREETKRYIRDLHWQYIFALTAGIVTEGELDPEPVAVRFYNFVRAEDRLVTALCVSNMDDLPASIENKFIDELKKDLIRVEQQAVHKATFLLGGLIFLWVCGLCPLSLLTLRVIPFDNTMNYLGLIGSVAYYVGLPLGFSLLYRRATKTFSDQMMAKIVEILFALDQAGIGSSRVRSALSAVRDRIVDDIPLYIRGGAGESSGFKQMMLREVAHNTKASGSSDTQLLSDLNNEEDRESASFELRDRLIRGGLSPMAVEKLVCTLGSYDLAMSESALFIFYNACLKARSALHISTIVRETLMDHLSNIMSDPRRRDDHRIWARATLRCLDVLSVPPWRDRIFIIRLRVISLARKVILLPWTTIRFLFRSIRHWIGTE